MSGVAVLLSFFVGYKYALKNVGAAAVEPDDKSKKTNDGSEGMVNLIYTL